MPHTRLILLYLFFLPLATWAQESDKIKIAINDLAAKGMEQATADICSDRLRNELVQTGAFRVMERGEMQSILKEQGFQQSGACDDQACMVEVGQLLGVQRMVAGSIGSVGSFYTISLRIIDVSNGEILSVVNEDFKGSAQELISKAMGSAARKLAQVTTDQKHPVDLQTTIPKPSTSPDKRFQSARRLTLGTVTLAAAGIGYAFERKANREYAAYDDTKGYNQPLLDENWQRVKSAEKTRTLCYMLSAIASVGFLISIPF